MFSAPKLVGIAAAIALAATFVTSIPREPDPEQHPAGSTIEDPVVTPVSGRMIVLSQDRHGDKGEHSYGITYTDELWTTTFNVDDPRLEGKSRSRHNRYTLPGSPQGLRAMTMWLENEGGSWVGEGRSYQDPATTGLHYRIVLEGQGGYDGLAAIIALDQEMFVGNFDVTGVVFPGGLPEVPGPAPTEFVVTDSAG